MMLPSSILLDMSKSFNVLPENMNLIMTFFMAGEVAGILVLIFLNKKFSGKKIIIWTYILIIPALSGLILIESLIFFRLLYFITGCLLGIIFMNANMSMLEGRVENKDSIVNLGHGFFAIGALTSPFVASFVVNRQINWRFLYFIIICLAAASFISYLLMHKKKQVVLTAEKIDTPLKEIFKSRKKNIYMILTSILMLFYVMSEVTIFSWAPTFFRVEKSFNIYNASLIVVLFWVGILAGRLIISVLSYKFKAGALLIALSAISLAGLAIVIFPSAHYVNFIGAGIMGLGFSGIPPLLIASAGRIFGSRKEVSLAILFIIGAASGSIIPFLIRFLANYNFLFSMLISIIFMAVFMVFVFIRKNYRKTLHDKNQ